MKRAIRCLFPVAVFCLLAVNAGWGQTVVLKNGQNIATLGLRRDAGTVLARIKTGETVGEIGYPVANIARIEFPEPPQIKAATDLIAQSKAADALKQLDPVVAFYAPFRDIPGNFWAPLTLLKIDALTDLHRDREADALVAELSRAGGANADIARAARIKQAAALERQGEHQKALAILDPILKEDLRPDALAEAWLNAGDAYLALKEYKSALLAYLHIPVFTPERKLLMPSAILGSGRAYLGLEDGQRAEAAFNEVISAYASSPEASEAKKQLQKLAGKTRPASRG